MDALVRSVYGLPREANLFGFDHQSSRAFGLLHHKSHIADAVFALSAFFATTSSTASVAPPMARSAGTSSRQRAIACGQRGWK